HWHGLLENDAFRRALLHRVACLAGRPGFLPAPDTSFTAARTAQLDLLGDLVSAHLDTTALTDLIERGPPLALPFIPQAPPAVPGGWEGKVWMAPDFNEPDAELIDLMENGPISRMRPTGCEVAAGYPRV
ncbi:MAG: cobyric acid synthase, partial [Anaerolineales bacterium]